MIAVPLDSKALAIWVAVGVVPVEPDDDDEVTPDDDDEEDDDEVTVAPANG